ncbi:MAG: hypothetical protein MJ244_06715 [Clostridia bacterium]|nr:hypothetical protein [Clostridia bacterium]
MVKIYLLKILSALIGVIAGVLYLCNVNMNIVVTLLATAGLLLFIDSKINKDNIYMSNLKYMADKNEKKNKK